MSAVTAHIAKWNLVADGAEIETPSSWLLPVRQGAVAAMLKVHKPESDERPGTDYLRYVGGNGAVRVMAADDDALLMERAMGARSLLTWPLRGTTAAPPKSLRPRSGSCKRRAVDIGASRAAFASLFDRAHEHPLLQRSAACAGALLASPRDVMALHGDLHHSNVLDGGPRGWLAIDPKGLLGERTYDLANLLGNPWPHGDIVHHSGRMQAIGSLYAERPGMAADRVLAFALAHAGLAARWHLDEGSAPAYRLKCVEVLAPLVHICN